MANAFSNVMENELLNHVLRGVPSIKRGSFWFALFTANPTDNGNANEVAGGSYARVEIPNTKENFPQCIPGGVPFKTNGESILFPTATAPGWGTITHYAYYDAPSALTVTGNYNNSTAVTGIASTAALRVGMTVTGTGVPAGTQISAMTSTTLTLNKTTTGGPVTGGTLTVSPQMILHGKLATRRFTKSGKTLKLQSDTLKLTIKMGPIGGFTDYIQRRLLNHVFGDLVYTPPATVFVGFGISKSINSETDPDKIEEWDDDAYTRIQSNFEAAVKGVCDNADEMLFTAVDGVVGGDATLTCLGIWDDDNAGHLLVVNDLRRAIPMKNENLLKISAGGLSVALN